MSLRLRLSDAVTVNTRPLAICCVSAVVVSAIDGGMTSRCTPPGLLAVSQPQTPAMSAILPHHVRTTRTRDIERSWLLPGAGRHQVVDDVRRDQDQEIAPLFRLGAEAEELAENRQVYKERDSRLGYSDRGHREAADDRGFAVVHQDLVVRLLRLEREPDVHGRGFDARVLGVDLHQHLTVGRHVWRHPQVDTGLLEPHGGAGWAGCAGGLRADVDHADRDAVADQNLGRAIVERGNG